MIELLAIVIGVAMAALSFCGGYWYAKRAAVEALSPARARVAESGNNILAAPAGAPVMISKCGQTTRRRLSDETRTRLSE